MKNGFRRCEGRMFVTILIRFARPPWSQAGPEATAALAEGAGADRLDKTSQPADETGISGRTRPRPPRERELRQCRGAGSRFETGRLRAAATTRTCKRMTPLAESVAFGSQQEGYAHY